MYARIFIYIIWTKWHWALPLTFIALFHHRREKGEYGRRGDKKGERERVREEGARVREEESELGKRGNAECHGRLESHAAPRCSTLD